MICILLPSSKVIGIRTAAYKKRESSKRVVEQENICRKISEDKIVVCEKTAGLRCGKFSELNSACSKVLVNSHKNISVPRYYA